MNEHNATEQAYKNGYKKGRADAIDLINRQKEIIEAAISAQETLQRYIAEKDAEIERFEKENHEKFNKWEILNNRTKQRYAELYEEAKAVVRAEAIKEFAERLKEQKYQSSDWSHGEHPFVVEEDDIDELVQEMVGDEDG